jgi:2-amino-4-hydroxy-6-hydroxymethyldihydropteridine diphosphokinase
VNPSEQAWVGLGANLGDPVAMVRQAFKALDELDGVRVASRSPLYRTPPMGPPGQPDYINAVAGLDTDRSPESLLESLLALESRMGRQRDGTRWGPRVIDLDLLCYGDRQQQSDFLTLPHPGIAERAFVLVPLAAVAPELEIPGVGRVSNRLGQMDADAIRPLDESWEE